MKTFQSFCRRMVPVLGLSLGLAVSPALAQDVAKPFVVPELQQWTATDGSFLPSTSSRITFIGGSDAQLVATRFADSYQALTGMQLPVVKGKARPGDFAFQLRKLKGEADESYSLRIGNNVLAQAHDLRGLQWAASTLLQLTRQDKALPCGEANDAPRYAMRGFMMDCGRKFIPMSYLRSLVKTMAYYKMNTLQIHLNDNGFRQFFGNDWSKTQAAFRLECDTYPGLTAKDGSYSKAEFIALQALADSCGVEIIPEIDVPAHTLAFTQYKPEIGSEEYGMDHLDLFKQETYDFCDGLFREYLEGKEPVFRGKRVHIGTDEYSNAKKEVVEKFRYFTDRYIRFVEQYGKQAVLWGSLTHAKGDTPVKSDNVLMHSWSNDYANPLEMKELGYRLISIPDGYVYIVPAAGYYYDYLNCQYLYEHWTPAVVGRERLEEGDPCLEGGMFAVWNDHCGNGISVTDIHDRLFPALQTMATKCWSGASVTLPYATYNTLRAALGEAPGENESGRVPGGYTQAEVKAGSLLPLEQAGYGHTVSFTIEAQPEAKGTELFRSERAVFYLSDPRSGRLGFERDGYLNTFNYRLPTEGKVEIAVECTNRQTVLYVNGKKREVLGPITLVAFQEKDLIDFQTDPASAKPQMYNPRAKMYYQRTLSFPLRQAGLFKSRITQLQVKENHD